MESNEKFWIDILNGIASYVKGGGYDQGMRNNIAVDLTIAARMINEDPYLAVTKISNECHPNEPWIENESTIDTRIDIVDDYQYHKYPRPDIYLMASSVWLDEAENMAAEDKIW